MFLKAEVVAHNEEEKGGHGQIRWENNGNPGGGIRICEVSYRQVRLQWETVEGKTET